MGLVFMILGFIWWWPLGLIILAALIASARIGYRRRMQFAGSGPTGEWDHLMRMDRTDRVPAKTNPLRVRGNSWAQPSSGNRAFDDYRGETLRRLEDEQREFKEFLKRLRVARDRSEFDQFMNERHNRLADHSLAPRGSIVATDIQGVSLTSDRGSR
jgi:Protein of unknown function (DUF2852)